jgi:HlyD family secretion protein
VRRLLLPVGVLLVLAGGALVGRAAFSRIGSAGADVPALEVSFAPFVRTVTAEGTLRPVTASGLSAPSEGRSQLIAWLAEDGASVKKGEPLIRFDNDDAVRALADGKDDHEAALTRIQKEKLQIANGLNERSRTAALTKEEIVRARELGKKDPRFFPRSEVIESEIDQGLLEARLKQTETASQVEQRLGKSRVELLAVDRQKAETQTRQAEKALRSLEIRAPHDGTFVLQRWGWGQRTVQAGDRAFSGMRIAEVTKSDRMDAEVMVLEADAGGLVPGKAATVVLDARPDVVWKARVKKVDPFPKPKSPEVPAQYFGALLAIEGDTSSVKPGQRLRATIVLDELPRALAVPRQAVFRKDGATIVHRRSYSGDFEPVPVKLGPGTVGRVVVLEGLRPGDRIALRDPGVPVDEAYGATGAGARSLGRAPPAEEGGGRGSRRR